MLTVPSQDEVAAFQLEVQRARAFQEAYGVLLAGGWGVGADMAAWLCGLQERVFLAVDQPDFMEDLLSVISAWNQARMRVVLEAGVDLFVRRGWYEGADFWSPNLFRRFILPALKREAELAHEYGALFGYTMTTGALPMLDAISEAGVDVLLGVDPLQTGEDPLQTMRDELGGRVCLWGGVSGAVTVEMGTQQEVRAAVRHAIQTLGPDGLVLSPVDNITVDAPQTWQNIDVFIDEWQQRGWTGP